MSALKVGALALGLASTVVVALTVVVAASAAPSGRLPLCAASGPIDGLTGQQAANARTIAATAEPRAGRQAALIAITVSLAESGLRVLGNPAAGTDPVGQGVGYDHDSVGLFQQRAGWGSVGERMDPVISTNLFVDALLSLPHWTELPLWVAAQEVQRSAFDGRPSAANHGSAVFGGNYLIQLPRAATIIRAIDATSSTDGCGGLDTADTVNAGSPGAYGLPAMYAIPRDTSPSARMALSYALAQRGKPYLWGGVGPDQFDCSGLTQRAWAMAGHVLGRTTYDQLRDGTGTTVAQLQPGDLILIPGSQGTLASPGHIGMYLGAGLVVHAPRTGDVVRVTTFDSFTGGGISGLRHIA
jgi:peptidoglycan DL-endopeptidase CwlO